MLPSRFRHRLQERVPHIVAIGLAMGAVDELRKLPLDLDANPPLEILLSGAGVFFNSLFVTFFLILAITAIETSPVTGMRRTALMTGAIGLAAAAASAAVSYLSFLRSESSLNYNVDDFYGLFLHIFWTALVIGALSVLYYLVWEKEQEVAEQMWAARLEQMDGERHLLESQLNAMKSRVEPAFLIGTIGKIEALCRRDSASAAQRLEDLIAYLRAALPQLRGTHSTLGDELALAEAYSRLRADDIGGGVGWRVNVDAGIRAMHFPPMALLPLVDDALLRAVSQAIVRLELQIRLHSDGQRFSLTVADNCAPGLPDSAPNGALLAHEQAFCVFFRGSATVARHTPPGGGAVVTLSAELPATGARKPHSG
jgi:sensor histidine kinase YesM